MAFENQAQEDIYQKLAEYLPVFFGEDDVKPRGDTGFWVRDGSAIVNVQARAWHDREAMVACWTPMVWEVKVTPELMRYLLDQNRGLMFGAFSLIEDGCIGYRYKFLWVSRDRAELKTTVKTVVRIADIFDDQIIARFGGKTGVAIAMEGAESAPPVAL